MRLLAVLAGLLAIVPAQGQTQGQTPEPVRAAQLALEQALASTPMTLNVVTFVRDRAEGFGMYAARGDSRFAKDEPLHIYVEPLGYKYKKDGEFETFGFVIDFSILKNDAILGGKEKFFDQTFRSHHENTEIMLNATIALSGAPPGEYQLELVVHDKSSADVARTRLPFTIAE